MKPTLDPQTQEFLLRQIQTATTEQELFEAAMMFNRVAPHIVLSGALRVAGAALYQNRLFCPAGAPCRPWCARRSLHVCGYCGDG